MSKMRLLGEGSGVRCKQAGWSGALSLQRNASQQHRPALVQQELVSQAHCAGECQR